jgi:hypothetical protein
MTVSKATGSFSGTFVHCDGKPRKIKGAFVQNRGGSSIAEGHFAGMTKPGLVTITALST